MLKTNNVKNYKAKFNILNFQKENKLTNNNKRKLKKENFLGDCSGNVQFL